MSAVIEITRPAFTNMTTTPIVSYNLISSVTSCLKRYCKASGRACRSEYWYWQLALVILGIIIAIIEVSMGYVDSSSPVGKLIDLALFLPGLNVFIRRMHDIGRSGWNFFWAFLPIIGWIILLVYCCKPSSEANQYGEGPDAPAA